MDKCKPYLLIRIPVKKAYATSFSLGKIIDMRQIKPLVCVKRRYEFNDGSVVLWTPADDSQKAHGLFRVDICIKIQGLPRVSWSHRSGPPSESVSLHWLKWAKKDANKKLL